MLKVLFKSLGVLVILGSFAGSWLFLEWQHFMNTPLLSSPQPKRDVIVIGSGTTLKQLTNELHREGYLQYPRFFELLGRWRGVSRHIKAGEYRIDVGMTPASFLQRIVSGEVAQYSLTLVEGWTFKQVIAAVQAQPRLVSTLNSHDDAAIMAQLGYPDQHPEGRFYPDTYFFPGGTTDVEFLQRAYRAMATHLEEEWAQRANGLPLRTPYEALVLASIVERETAVSAERSQIAGVFIRRLRKGMRLQTDPTVIYGMGERFDGNIRRRDLLADTPYNTYTRKGLPPTPIAMPSRASVHATLHPDDGDTLYFVSRGDGSHYFSATLEEHNNAVREYQILAPRRARQATNP